MDEKHDEENVYDASRDHHSSNSSLTEPRPDTTHHCPQEQSRDEAETPQLSRPASRVIHSTFTHLRTCESHTDPGPPPDGGRLAWSHTVLVHLICIVVWGTVSSFGVFETYYTSILSQSTSAISWIGGVQTFLTFFIGTFSGRALDGGFYKPTFLLGSFLVLLGIFMTSLSRTYWQIFLAQAVCQGLGHGTIFVPSMALLSTYFSTRRGLAIGLAASGAGVGGVIFPLMVQKLLPKIGFAWTVRVIGLVVMACLGIPALGMRPRLPPRKSGPIVEWSSFREGPYSLFCVGSFLMFWGIYTGFFYVSSFARTQLGVSYSTSLNVLLAMNAIGILSRPLSTHLSDLYLGPLNTLLLFLLPCTLSLYLWTQITTLSSLYIFAVVFGIGAAAIQALFPVCLGSLTTNPQKTGVRMGMCFSIVGIAVLTGPGISGALVGKGGRNGNVYFWTQIWTGSALATAVCVLALCRTVVINGRGGRWFGLMKV